MSLASENGLGTAYDERNMYGPKRLKSLHPHAQGCCEIRGTPPLNAIKAAFMAGVV